ncbi:MAG: hypothetical protein QOG36_120 [Actinomycetota bacterium]|nr:hypothetical protein [Actinomycetota bacterium]
MKRGWLVAAVLLIVMAAAGGFELGRLSKRSPVRAAASPRIAPTVTVTVTPAVTPTVSPGESGTQSPTTETGLSVAATFNRLCGGVMYTQCLTQARAAIKNDQALTRQNCAAGAVQACPRQFGDPLVQGCFPASDAQGPAWGPDGWCTLVNNLLTGA